MMDTLIQLIQILFSWQFVTIGLATYAIVLVLRKVLEYLMETFAIFSKESKLWNDLVLPICPYFVGPLLAIALTTLPYPAGLVGTLGVRFIFGLVSGAMSGLIYRVINSFYGDKLSGMLQSVVSSISSSNKTTDQSNNGQ